MLYKFFYRKSSGGAIKSEPNHQLANELHNQIRKFKRIKFIHLLETIFGVLI